MNNDERKAQLVAALRTTGEEAGAALRAMPEDDFALGRYENGWTAREILAHLAAIEWTYPRMLDLPELPTRSAPGVERVASPEVGSRMDEYNRKQVERRSARTVAELIDEFVANRAATIAAVQAADASLFGRQVESFGGMRGSLADVLEGVMLGHAGGHVKDITG